MMKYNNIIAIDPDVDKSGFAVLLKADRRMSVQKLAFPALIDEIRSIYETTKENGADLVVVVEASWMTKNNWHLSLHETKQRAAAKGYDVGRNHQVGHLIVEMCRSIGVEVIEHFPLRKSWKGTDGKITQGEIEQFIPNFPKRTNQEERDAALLAWCFGNMPIQMRC